MSEPVIKERLVHANVGISIDPNRTTAFMTITPPENGGFHITMDKVLKEMSDRNITYGILNDSIKFAVDNRRYNENICVARWTPPVNGVDGTIEYLFKRENHKAPVEDENGVVDFKNLGLVQNIFVGTRIAEITMPTQGKPGTDITGKPVRQKPGVPARFTLGRGTALTEDGTQIVATVDGNLSYSKGCFNVDETLLINGDVSNATGNIDFIGNVIIKGNIFEGFRVASKKDITINGTATKAELNAGGNIHVKIGCINCNIQCKGNARIGFCENSKIHCEGNLESSSFIGGEAFAGKSINVIGKGKIVGGKYTALENIEASTIGNENYIKTYITLGNNAVLSEEREYDQRHIEELEDKFEQLGKIMTTLAEMARAAKLPPEREQMKVEVMKSRFQIQGELRRLRVRMAEIDAALERKQNLSVSCQKAFYPGVTIRINSLVYNVNVMTPHCKAVIGDAEIELRPL